MKEADNNLLEIHEFKHEGKNIRTIMLKHSNFQVELL